MIKRENGFTIAELLIAVVIIAILAALTIPRFAGNKERAIAAEAIGMLSAIRQAEAAYRLENPAYIDTTDFTSAGPLDVDASSSTKFSYKVTDSTATTFNATATQLTDHCKDRTIILNAAGTFSGDHPYGPVPGTGKCTN